jgi:dUTP pyrophosphatase
MVIKIMKLNSDAKIPTRATYGAAGFDLYAAHDCFLPREATRIIGTGIALEIPFDMEGQIRSRSGLAADRGIFVLNSPGTIDSDYRGEIKVILRNSGSVPTTISKGDRIAQIIFTKLPLVDMFEVKELSITARQLDGLGSTGK